MRYNCLLVHLLAILFVVGCSYIGGNNAGARKALEQKLDAWILGEKDDHLVMPIELSIVDPPTSYVITSFLADNHDQSGNSFLASVTLEFKSQADTPIKKILRYKVYWDDRRSKWKVVEASQKVFDQIESDMEKLGSPRPAATSDPKKAAPPGVREAQQAAQPAVNGPNGGLAPPQEPEARKPEAKPKPPSAQALYDQAIAIKDMDPEKCLELLRDAQKRTRDNRLFQEILADINELEFRPDVLYARAVKLKKSDPKQARDFIKAALNGPPNEQLKQKLLDLRSELAGLTADGDPEVVAPAPLTEEETRQKTIFKDWAKQRGDALKNAQKMPKARGDAYMKSVDQRLVRELTKKYNITHEELDRIEAYGAARNWW